mgnify:CR=1 FL=1
MLCFCTLAFVYQVTATLNFFAADVPYHFDSKLFTNCYFWYVVAFAITTLPIAATAPALASYESQPHRPPSTPP